MGAGIQLAGLRKDGTSIANTTYPAAGA